MQMGCAPDRHRFEATGPGCSLHTADFDDAGAITPAAYASHAQRWRELGASVIGGCCGVGPAHVREVASRLRGDTESGTQH